jgi:hypothetical protein
VPFSISASTQPSPSASKKAAPAPFVSTMKRFFSRPPYTDGRVSPAFAPTSTKRTGQGGAAEGASARASSRNGTSHAATRMR